MDLPVYQIQEQLIAPFSPEEPKRILLKAPTGSGKSTAVPPMLLDAGETGLIVVIQPRRIAARMLASRVASLRSTDLGSEVGYVVRFDNKMSEATRIVYVTDGIFQNWLEENPELKGISTVVFDEFHERRVAGDVTLAKCLNLQESSRDDLKVVVMSATLEMSGLNDYMSPCRELEASGRTFPVEIEYRGEKVVTRSSNFAGQAEPIWEKCVKATRDAIIEDDPGHVLIFLPGVFEINKTVRLLEEKSWFRGWKICPLYSALPPRLQDEAVSPSAQPKIIVSTNVAETSLTIDGVRTVIDAGLARISEFDPNRGIDTLMVQQISQAAADQRAGRAGRTAPGRCVRLWSHTSHAKRKEFELPEIQRVDLAEIMLKLASRGEDIRCFRWLDKPEVSAVDQAEQTLKMLEALDEEGQITELGHKMAKFPLPPRFARLIFAGVEEECVAEAAFIAAAIQGEGIFTKRRGTVGRSDFLYDEDLTDFAGEYRGYEAAEQVDFNPKRCGQFGILARGAKECGLAFKQIKEQLSKIGVECKRVRFERREEAVCRAAVKAFGDRIGVKLSSGTMACRLVDGRKGMLDADSVVKNAEMFIPTEITEVDGRDVVVHLNRAIGLSSEMLRSSFADDFTENEECEFDSMSRRVVKTTVTRFKGLVIDKKSGGDPDPELASTLLAQKVASGELVLKQWDKQVETWIARLLGLREWMPELELPTFGEEDKSLALEQLCQGAVSYKDIKNKEVLPAVRAWLSGGQQAALDAYAPEKIKLSNGQSAKVYYESGKTPWIAMTAQRLIGVEKTPTIANGSVKLSIQICAPNNRPWQITDDLESFWKSGFEQMRKDLGGRYPKHQWSLE